MWRALSMALGRDVSRPMMQSRGGRRVIRGWHVKKQHSECNACHAAYPTYVGMCSTGWCHQRVRDPHPLSAPHWASVQSKGCIQLAQISRTVACLSAVWQAVLMLILARGTCHRHAHCAHREAPHTSPPDACRQLSRVECIVSSLHPASER